jgi:hypothetical protein
MSQLEWKDFAGPTSVLIASIVTQLVTVILVFVSQRQAYKRYGREKMWDLKRELYSKALSKLTEMYNVYISIRKRYPFPTLTKEQASEVMPDEEKVFSTIIDFQTLIHDNEAIFSKSFVKLCEPIHGIYDVVHGTAANDYARVLAVRKREIHDIHKTLLEQTRKELGTGD